MPKLVNFFAACLFSFVCFFTGAVAQPFDPCPRLLNAEEEDASVARYLWGWFKSEPDLIEGPAYSDHDYFVTVHAGRFVNIRCDDQQFEEQEMYPIGVVVKPIAYVPLPDFELARGDRAILVLTEYGQRKLIRERDIAPIASNLFYIFSDTPNNARICRTEADCPGNGVDFCKRPQQCRYEIASAYGYATASANNPVARSAIAAYDLIQNGTILSDANASDESRFKRVQSVDQAACMPFPVRAYKSGGTAHQPRPSYFTLCTQRTAASAGSNAVTRLKVVSLNTARRAFTWQLDGSFHRRFAQRRAQESTTLAGAVTDYPITWVKECETEIEDISKFALSGGLKASFSAGILELSAGADTTVETAITRTLGADDYLLMSTYFIDPIVNAPEVAGDDKDDLWLFRVIFRSACENRVPSSATSVIIHYRRLPGGVMEVSAANDLENSYLEDWANFAYAPNKSIDSLREGQFWTVPDLSGYFVWRDTLRHFIEFDNIKT
ncbi:MAG: hypothetical protein AAFQ04_12790, partial [Pseudomonadota bacterium]